MKSGDHDLEGGGGGSWNVGDLEQWVHALMKFWRVGLIKEVTYGADVNRWYFITKEGHSDLILCVCRWQGGGGRGQREEGSGQKQVKVTFLWLVA